MQGLRELECVPWLMVLCLQNVGLVVFVSYQSFCCAFGGVWLQCYSNVLT